MYYQNSTSNCVNNQSNSNCSSFQQQYQQQQHDVQTHTQGLWGTVWILNANWSQEKLTDTINEIIASCRQQDGTTKLYILSMNWIHDWIRATRTSYNPRLEKIVNNKSRFATLQGGKPCTNTHLIICLTVTFLHANELRGTCVLRRAPSPGTRCLLTTDGQLGWLNTLRKHTLDTKSPR